jgi:outer membrane protein assembly factor BamE
MGALLAGTAGFAGCSAVTPSGGFLGLITPYRVEVVQGNVVTQEQVARVKIGMSRAQVRDILGSPLLADVFHADRWDYIFTIRRQGAAPQRHSIVALFDGERLTSLDTGGELPGEEAFVASIDTARPPSKAPTLVLTDEQLQALKVPPKPPAAAAQSPAAPAAARTYPPLESR